MRGEQVVLLLFVYYDARLEIKTAVLIFMAAINREFILISWWSRFRLL